MKLRTLRSVINEEIYIPLHEIVQKQLRHDQPSPELPLLLCLVRSHGRGHGRQKTLSLVANASFCTRTFRLTPSLMELMLCLE